MHIVTICLRQSPTQLQFVFKEFIGAQRFRDAINQARAYTNHEDAKPGDDWKTDLRDDYSRVFDVLLEEIGAIVIGHYEDVIKGQQELAIGQARAQAETQAKVMSDPKMRFIAAGALPGNGIIS